MVLMIIKFIHYFLGFIHWFFGFILTPFLEWFFVGTMERRNDELDKVIKGIRNNTVTEIWFSNSIDFEGAKALASALEKNNTVARVWLDARKMKSKGVKLIASALEKNKTVLEIDLYRAAIDTDGARALAKALEKNNTLLDNDASRF